MSEDITYNDSEFSLAGTERIDFKSILFKQIDYIRFLRTQDMGEFTLLDFEAIPQDETIFLTWFSRNSTFQNSVKALQGLLRTYHDDTYLQNIKSIEERYSKTLDNALKKILKHYEKYKNLFEKQRKQRDDSLTYTKKEFSITQLPKKYDEIFEECLLLMERAKFIGGNDLIGEISI